MFKRHWPVVVFSLLSVAFLASLAWWLFRPRPSLDGIERLVTEGRHDEVEARLLAYLAQVPDDQAARLMLGRYSVDRPDHKPDLALQQVAAIKPTSRRWRAQINAIQGEAYFQKRKYHEAETAWLEALHFDPKTPEVGWGLLNLYSLQSRDLEARRLGLRLAHFEPDPHDRVQLLLQLIRHDAHAISAASVVIQLTDVVRENPDDLPSTLALARALVREGKTEPGLALLRSALDSHPNSPEAWDSYLNALTDLGQIDPLSQALESLPSTLADDPRFNVPRGWLAAQKHDWPAAARAYRRAWDSQPADIALAYRLQSALRNGAGPFQAEFDQLAPQLQAASAARDRLRALYDQLDAIPDLGHSAHPDLYREVADALTPLGRRDEALAWRALAEGKRPPPPSPPAKLP